MGVRRLFHHQRHHYLILLLVVLHRFSMFPLSAQAQISQAQLFHTETAELGKAEFTRLGIEQGLSLGSVNCLLQDRYGFLWIGTQDGLNRYDGYSFKIYRPNNSIGITDSTMLQEFWISSLLEDKAGTLWIAGGRGLHRFHRATNTFEKIAFASETTPSSVRVLNERLYEDSKGNIWLCTKGGIIRYNPRTKVSEQFFVPIPTDTPRRPKNIEVFVEDMLEEADGSFILACSSDGLYRFFPQEKHLDKRFQRFCLSNLNPLYTQAIRLTRDKRGMVWMGTNNGLICWNSSTLTAEKVFLADSTLKAKASQRDYFYIETTVSARVQDILHSRTGKIWIATERGLFTLDPAHKHLTQFLHVSFDPTSIAGNMPRTLVEDNSGVLWVGDYSYGLSKLPQLQQRFITYRHNPLDSNSLTDNYIRGLYEDSQGNLWVCAQFGGLNMLDRKSGKWTHYRYNPKNSSASLPSDNIWAVTEGADGMIWAGMIIHGICTINPKTRVVKRFSGFLYDDESVLCLLRDNENNIWAGGSDVYKIAPNGRILKTFPFIHTLSTQTIFQDRHSVVWIGRDDGLWKVMAGDSVVAVRLPIDNVVITMINEDTQGNLWITSKGHGVFCMNPARTESQHFTTADGLPHQNIYAALEDAHGDMWFSSDNGIARLNPQSKQIRLYSIGDGLQSQEFNRRAFAQTSRGEILFGGINGVNIFQPTSLRDNTTPPRVVLTSLQVRGKEIAEAAQLLDMQEIRLPYTDNFLQCSFAALDYSNPSMNQYAYKLEGLDEEWIQAGSRHDATYTNLAPGRYTLTVRAANADGYWNTEGRSLSIIILPPWWRTYWAYGGYAALIAGGLSAMVMLISHRQKRNFAQLQAEREAILLNEKNQELLQVNATLQMLNMEKSEMLGIVSHDLKNPIGGVRGLAELMQQGYIASEQIPLIATQIVETSDRMFDLVSNLLDMNQLETGQMPFNIITVNMALILGFTVKSFQITAQNKGIHLHLDIEPMLFPIHADERAMMQVLENIISNAIKYSPLGKSIRIRAFNEDATNSVRIEVQDQGQGLTEEDKRKLFGKFTRLSARPTGGEHSTGLGLSIVKRLVEAMNGQVWCESEYGHGATFILRFLRTEEYSEQTVRPRVLSL
ncbi:MAG: hypothetical protein EAZ92_05640 [Candidatus Kapaibacterium sp.]|nr:MAG: hypothetical protein EAZ92_05640 [Candidatus Kapabacteria bacterium]